MPPEITTKDEFTSHVGLVESRNDYRRPRAFGIGIAHVDSQGNLLDTWFPFPNLNENFGSAAVFADAVGHLSGTESLVLVQRSIEWITACFAVPEFHDGTHGNVEAFKSLVNIYNVRNKIHGDMSLVVSFIDQEEFDQGPQDVSDAYLRLHLLSSRKLKPGEVNLNGIFSKLPVVAWTNEGPIGLEDLKDRRMSAMISRSPLHVTSVDKFPPMTDYVVPSGVRIADASRVRLGAHLGKGTTVMHEGFVNFNAGTLGTSMVEGRVPPGVTVGDQTDIGGGASIMGTLSGGGKEKITIGRGCLLGANSGTGISLGDLCAIEAGLYVTAGTPVLHRSMVVKASSLSGKDKLTFRRNSQTGVVEALNRPNNVVLNEVLHKN